jgi:hypothetical protein
MFYAMDPRNGKCLVSIGFLPIFAFLGCVPQGSRLLLQLTIKDQKAKGHQKTKGAKEQKPKNLEGHSIIEFAMLFHR